MKRNLILFATCLLFASCQKEDVNELVINKGRPNQLGKIRTDEEVRSLALYLFKNSNSNPRAVVSSTRKDDIEISALTTDLLGENNVHNDTLLFLVKDSDMGNSIIVSANRDCDPIIAVLDNSKPKC